MARRRPRPNRRNSGGSWLVERTARAADQYFQGTGQALNSSNWGPDGGPYTSAFTSGNVAHFNVANGTGSGSISITVSSIIATENFTNSSTSGTLATGGTVAAIDVSAGKLLNFGGSSAVSTAAGTGVTKNGSGALSFTGSAFAGGFTLNAGTMILRGSNSMGNGALTLNGGIVAANGNQDLSGKFTSITIGGDVQFNDNAFALEDVSSNLTFSNSVGLGGANRTLTLGGSGNVAFGGVISNTGSNGVTFAANVNGTGRFDITNAANTFSGPLTITGGEARFTDNGSVGNANNTIVIDGGRFATLSGASYALASTHSIQVSAAAGTSISVVGGGTLTYNGAIVDKPSTTGSWAKQGSGTLALGGASIYTGATGINNGTVQLTSGNNRLPTSTTVSLGQAASANLGTLDLNSQSQEVAGLNSTPGTNSGANNNTVTSASAATLTLSGTGNYSYGDGTSANSGVITGAIDLVKKGAGTQTLGDANSYTGGTIINDGIVYANNTSGSATGSGAVVVANAGPTQGKLAGTGAISGDLKVQAGGRVAPGASIGTLTFNGGVSNFDGTLEIEYNGFNNTIDLAQVAGALFLGNNSIVSFSDVSSPTTPLSLPSYVFATYTPGMLTGTFNTAQNPPPGYTIVYNFGGNSIALVAVPEASALLFGGLVCCALGLTKCGPRLWARAKA